VHRDLLFEALGLDTAIDYSTLEFLGNTGAVGVIITAAIGAHLGLINQGDHVGLWGIGSGINVVGFGLDWQQSLVDEESAAALPPAVRAQAAGGLASRA